MTMLQWLLRLTMDTPEEVRLAVQVAEALAVAASVVSARISRRVIAPNTIRTNRSRPGHGDGTVTLQPKTGRGGLVREIGTVKDSKVEGTNPNGTRVTTITTKRRVVGRRSGASLSAISNGRNGVSRAGNNLKDEEVTTGKNFRLTTVSSSSSKAGDKETARTAAVAAVEEFRTVGAVDVLEGVISVEEVEVEEGEAIGPVGEATFKLERDREKRRTIAIEDNSDSTDAFGIPGWSS